MLHAFQEKSVVAIMATAATTGETLTARIDRLGFDYVSIDAIISTVASTSNSPAVLKITESDITDATGFSAIAALTGGAAGNTSGNFVIPAADTQNTNVIRFNIDCRARKRYLLLTVNPKTTSTVVMAARLRRSEQTPATTTAAGVLAIASA